MTGRIVGGSSGTLGHWLVHNGKADTKVDAVKVGPGEAIDFVVLPGPTSTSDTFTWAPTIVFTGENNGAARTWNARKDFDTPRRERSRLDRWEELAQVLLLANELAFVD